MAHVSSSSPSGQSAFPSQMLAALTHLVELKRKFLWNEKIQSLSNSGVGAVVK